MKVIILFRNSVGYSWCEGGNWSDYLHYCCESRVISGEIAMLFIDLRGLFLVCLRGWVDTVEDQSCISVSHQFKFTKYVFSILKMTSLAISPEKCR